MAGSGTTSSKAFPRPGLAGRWWLSLILAALVLVVLDVLLAQSNLLGDVRPPPAITAEPQDVLAHLSAAPSFPTAVADFQSALGVAEGDIRVHLVDTSACTLCEMKENAVPDASLLSVKEATPQVGPGYSFWLYVGPFRCGYYFAADGVRPLDCTNQRE